MLLLRHLLTLPRPIDLAACTVRAEMARLIVALPVACWQNSGLVATGAAVRLCYNQRAALVPGMANNDGSAEIRKRECLW